MSSDVDKLREKISKLEESLDKAYHEMAEGVREYLDMSAAVRSLGNQKDFLKEAAIKAITASSNIGKEGAEKMLNAWYEKVKKTHKVDKE